MDEQPLELLRSSLQRLEPHHSSWLLVLHKVLELELHMELELHRKEQELHKEQLHRMHLQLERCRTSCVHEDEREDLLA